MEEKSYQIQQSCTYKIGLQKKICTAYIKQEITIDEYVTMVRNHDPIVDEARQILATSPNGKKDPRYRQIKETERPAMQVNYRYWGDKRQDARTKESTGVLFVDIDDVAFDLSSLYMDKVMVINRSLSGQGWHILVKVNQDDFNSLVNGIKSAKSKSDRDIVKGKFKIMYDDVCEQIGLPVNTRDAKAMQPTQPTTLGYDSNIIYNPNSTIVSISEKCKDDLKTGNISIINKGGDIVIANTGDFTFSESDTLFVDNEKWDRFVYNSEFIPIRYSTQLEEYTSSCDYIEDGKEFVCCFIPFDKDGISRIIPKKRKITIGCYANNLLYLNPNIGLNQFRYELNKVNTYCYEPLVKDIIDKIIRERYVALVSGKLEPIQPKTKKWWVNNNITGYIMNEKGNKVSNKLLAFHDAKKNLTQSKLDIFFENICSVETKVTISVIAEKTGVSERTIKGRLTAEHWDIIETHNTFIKDNKKTFVEDEVKTESVTHKLHWFFELIDCEDTTDKITYNYIANRLKISLDSVKRKVTEEQKQILKTFNKNRS